MSTELATQQPRNVREALALPAYRERFSEVLRDRAPQFMSALIQLSQDPQLAKCDPKSVIGAAMTAATLDLPIEKSLGQAHIVSYGNQAQFQLGWKAYVQLAHRSGQYARLNAKPVNAEAFQGYDEVGEPIIDWSKLDETLPPVGYAFAFKLVNGFAKVCYWPKAKVDAHAKKFSQAYRAGRQSSPWFTNFDAMALKTVVMNELRQWGVLSVQMQTALERDQAVIKDVGAEPEFVDNSDSPATGDEQKSTRPPPPPRKPKGAAAVKEVVVEETAAVTAMPGAAQSAPAPAPAPAKQVEAVAAFKPDAKPMPEETAPGAYAAPETPDEIPGLPEVRTELLAGETVTITARVITSKVGKAGDGKPYVGAEVESSSYKGAIYDRNGAPDGTIRPEYLGDAPVRLTLKGEKQKSGKVLAFVEKVG